MRAWIVVLTACAAGKDPAVLPVANGVTTARPRATTHVSWVLRPGQNGMWDVDLELTDAEGWTSTMILGPARGALEPGEQQRCGARAYPGDVATLTFVENGRDGFAIRRRDDGELGAYRWTVDGAECANTHGRSCPRLMRFLDTLTAREIEVASIQQVAADGWRRRRFSCETPWLLPTAR